MVDEEFDRGMAGRQILLRRQVALSFVPESGPFVYNRDRRNGDAWPASDLDLEDGFERPVDVEFGPDGLLYVLDFGVLTFYEGQQGFPKTGRLFRIEPLP